MVPEIIGTGMDSLWLTLTTGRQASALKRLEIYFQPIVASDGQPFKLLFII